MELKGIQGIRISAKEIFTSKQLHEDLSGRSARNGLISVTAQGIVFLLLIGRTMVLARLLTPRDFGIIGMVSTVTGFVAMFKDVGLPTATIQKDHISEGQISTLFWVNCLTSIICGLCIIASAPFIAMFYGEPELKAVTIVISFSFIIQGLSIQHSALLRRHMYFTSLAIEQVVTNSISMLVAVYLALRGWSYWALAVSSIVSAITSLFLTYFFCPWLPKMVKKGIHVRGMLKFGAHITIFNFANFFSRNADDILVGRFLGANALGFYSKAYEVVQIPIRFLREPITRVAMPTCSRIQNDSERLRVFASKYVLLLAFFCMPLMTIVFVFSGEVILVFLGEKWRDLNPLFKIFAIVGFIQIPANVKGLMLLSCGKSRQYMIQGVALSIVNVFSFVIGLQWGIVGVASAYMITQYIIQFPTFWYTCRHTPLRIRDFINNIYRPALASLVAGLGLAYVSTLVIIDVVAIRLSILFGLLLIVYLLVFLLLPGGCAILKNDIYRVFQKGMRSGIKTESKMADYQH